MQNYVKADLTYTRAMSNGNSKKALPFADYMDY
jgi:hypothetical protein